MNPLGWVLIVVGAGVTAYGVFITVCLGLYVWAMGRMHANGDIDLGDVGDEP